MIEEKKIICKSCGVEQLRIYAEKYNHKDKRWIGVDHTQWNGKKYCPECNRKRVRDNMRKLRAGKKNEIESNKKAK